MTMKLMANRNWQDDAVDRQAVMPPGRAPHANDEAAPMVLVPPRKLVIPALRTAFTGPRMMVLEEEANSVVLLLPIEGEGDVLVGGKAVELTPLRPMLFGRGEVQVAWKGDARALILRLPRSAIQIMASARHGCARRLAPRLFSIDLSHANPLRQMLADFAVRDADEDQGGVMLGAIVAAVAAQHGADRAFPPSRSISVARALLDRGTTVPLSLDELAGKAGGTAITLQRGFKSCFGMTVAGYSQAVRLHGARTRLQCGWESRSIAAIAQGGGFQSVTTFARAYQKLFGETPTQTRAMASRMNNYSHIDST